MISSRASRASEQVGVEVDEAKASSVLFTVHRRTPGCIQRLLAMTIQPYPALPPQRVGDDIVLRKRIMESQASTHVTIFSDEVMAVS